MSLPTTTRAFRRTKDGKGIEQVQDKLPSSLQPNQVLLRIHAVSLNYRDVAMLKGLYPVQVIDQGVPCSDGAATVVAVGSSVSKFKKDDYVTPSFTLNHLRPEDKGEGRKALGGDVDGVLREYAIYQEDALTKVPGHLSYEEASTIACAGVTAWTALEMDRKAVAESALMEGTGGVSLFAMLICIAAGITPVITSSSDKKLEQVKAHGTSKTQVLGINYKTYPDWNDEAKRLTNGRGVDVVVNNVGITSMKKSIDALAPFKGTVSCVGFLGGMGDPSKRPDTVIPLMTKAGRIQ